MIWSVVSLMIFAGVAVNSVNPAKHDNPFFAMDTCLKQHYPASDMTIDQQLGMVKQLGYAGLSWTQGDNRELREVVSGARSRGLKLFAHYAGATLRRDRLEVDPKIDETLDILKGSGAILWLHIGSADFAHSSPDGDDVAVDGLRDLSDRAAARGLRVALYPHVGEWVERVQDALRVAEKVGRPNLGVTFNLCHCLKVGDEARIPELLRQVKPRLFMVTINGADTGSSDAGWDRLIQTLDHGSFDVVPVLRILRDIGYDGPIGLQGYGWKGDVRDNLARSIDAWRRLHKH